MCPSFSLLKYTEGQYNCRHPLEFKINISYFNTGLSIDFTTDRLWWVDHKKMIVNCKLDGSNLTIHHLDNVDSVSAITIHEDKIYVAAKRSDNSESIIMLDKTGLFNHGNVIRENTPFVHAIKVYSRRTLSGVGLY